MENNSAKNFNKKHYDSLASHSNGAICEEPLGYIVFPMIENYISSRKIHPSDMTVLDIGAGDSGVPTDYLVKYGFKVVETDISNVSLQRLLLLFEDFESQISIESGDIFDVLDNYNNMGQKFDLIIARAFLHHIPDTTKLLEKIKPVLNENGVFISFADPLRYDTLSYFELLFSKIDYYLWRIRQGNLKRGINSFIRRGIRNKLDESLEEDMLEYHVVRNGLDQELIENFWKFNGVKCEVIKYYWSPSKLFILIANFFKVKNGFAIKAGKNIV